MSKRLRLNGGHPRGPQGRPSPKECLPSANDLFSFRREGPRDLQLRKRPKKKRVLRKIGRRDDDPRPKPWRANLSRQTQGFHLQGKFSGENLCAPGENAYLNGGHSLINRPREHPHRSAPGPQENGDHRCAHSLAPPGRTRRPPDVHLARKRLRGRIAQGKPKGINYGKDRSPGPSHLKAHLQGRTAHTQEEGQEDHWGRPFTASRAS